MSEKIDLLMNELFEEYSAMFGEIEPKLKERIVFVMSKAYRKGTSNMAMAVLEMQRFAKEYRTNANKVLAEGEN